MNVTHVVIHPHAHGIDCERLVRIDALRYRSFCFFPIVFEGAGSLFNPVLSGGTHLNHLLRLFRFLLLLAGQELFHCQIHVERELLIILLGLHNFVVRLEALLKNRL